MKKLEGVQEKTLALGEHTGHAHRVTVDVYEREDKVREFKGATTITHEEHKPIEIPQGEWLSDKVIEQDHFERAARRVRD